MPTELHVKAGTTVEWTNQDDILHTVTSGTRTYNPDGTQKDITTGPPGFDFQLNGKGAKASYTFRERGTVPYLCTRHPGMDAKIIVE
jgi:plastocyanin